MEIKPKLLIIGGTGFIGSHLVNIALKKYTISILYFSKKKIKIQRGVKYFKCDLSNTGEVIKILSKYKFEYIINASGYIVHEKSNEKIKKVYDAHYYNIKKLLDYLIRQKSLKKFVQISTSDIYRSSQKKLKEGENEYPLSPYAFAKFATDVHLQNLYKVYKFPFHSFRIFI